MLKRALFVVGILAVVLTGLAPAGDGCALASAIDHGCCEAAGPAPIASCCSTSNGGAAENTPEQELGCDCPHPADATAHAALTTTVKPSEDSSSFEIIDADRAPQRTATTKRGVGSGSFRAHPPPPAFLLNASFLN
jgi:hypothetical protein